MAAGRRGVLAVALITNFLGAGLLQERDCSALLSDHTSQKHFGHRHLALFSTYIQPSMGMQGASKHFTKLDQQRGELLIIIFSLLLAGDVHQCPGPRLCSESAAKLPNPDSITTSNSSGLQIQTVLTNVVQTMTNCSPDSLACSTDDSVNIPVATAMQSGFRGPSANEGVGELLSLRRCTSSLAPGDTLRRCLHTDVAQGLPDGNCVTSSLRAITVQSLDRAQPADLTPLTSTSPGSTLCDGPGKCGPVTNSLRSRGSTSQQPNSQRRATGLNPAIKKLRKLNFLQTVNNARVLWDPCAKPSGLLGGHLNIRSLIPKSDQIKHLLTDSNLDFLCLSRDIKTPHPRPCIFLAIKLLGKIELQVEVGG